MKKKRPLVTVCLSDVHCGSIVGLMPPEFVLDSGNVLRHGKNAAQRWLWSCWLDVWDEINAILDGDPFVLALNGDMTEGVHHGGKELVAQKSREHAQIAAEVLFPHVEAAAVVKLTEGTECHTHDAEHDLVKIWDKGTCRPWQWWEMNGVTYNMAHHIGVTSRAYLEAGAMSIEMGNAILNQVRAGHRTADIFLRGHRHCGGAFDDGRTMLAVTPAWQMLTRHGRKVVPNSIPRPGAIVLDHRGQRPGRLPAVHKLFFNPPQDEIEKVS
jgi:hypothetical protein